MDKENNKNENVMFCNTDWSAWMIRCLWTIHLKERTLQTNSSQGFEKNLKVDYQTFQFIKPSSVLCK